MADKVEEKKPGEFKEWKQNLILYDLTVKFLKTRGRKPEDIGWKLWGPLEKGYLEQFAEQKRGPPQAKRMRASSDLGKRSKMRIVGVVLLLALGAAFWKISLDACKDIAADLKIPDTVILKCFGLLGCEQDEVKVQMMTKVVLRSPGLGVEGRWWE